jgi:hypothetical protein
VDDLPGGQDGHLLHVVVAIALRLSVRLRHPLTKSSRRDIYHGYCLVAMSALRRRPHTGIAIRLILRRVRAERQQGELAGELPLGPPLPS